MAKAEVRQGILTEEACKDTRQNAILQNFGSAKIVVSTFYVGKTNKQVIYLLRSAGFIHEITEIELRRSFNSNHISSDVNNPK